MLGKRWILLWFECHLEDLEDELLWSMAVYGIFGRWFSGCMLLLKFFGGQHDRASPEKRKHVCLLRVLRIPEKAPSATPYHASDRAGNPLVHMLFHN